MYIFRKVILSYLCVFSIVFLFWSCKVEPTVYSNVTADEYFSSADEAQLALNGVYNAAWDLFKQQIFSNAYDETTGIIKTFSSKTVWSEFSWTNNELYLQSLWNEFYNTINRANTLIDAVHGNDKMPGDVKNSIIGQARTLRAYCYFELVQLWGGVPLQLTGTKDLSTVDLPRSSEAEVYDQIINDLNTAYQELSPFNPSEHTKGKISSASAQGLLVNVYAQQKNWPKVAEIAEQIINSGNFLLLNDYHEIFKSRNGLSSEELFSIRHEDRQGSGFNSPNAWIEMFTPPRINYNNMEVLFYNPFLMNNASAIVDTDFFNETPNTYRKWWTMRDKMPYYIPRGTTDIIYDTVKLDYPAIVKYYDLDESTTYLRRGINTILVRYSNILLVYAEALNELNGGPTNEAYLAINDVRKRARGVGTEHEQPNSVYPLLEGLTQAQFRDSVIIEFAREFIAEGRYRSVLLRHDRFISDAISRGKNADEFRKLFPIPIEEIERNPNLVQNTGY